MRSPLPSPGSALAPGLERDRKCLGLVALAAPVTGASDLWWLQREVLSTCRSGAGAEPILGPGLLGLCSALHRRSLQNLLVPWPLPSHILPSKAVIPFMH